MFHDGLVLTGNAGAKLYYNNGLKFQTTNTGADLTGEFIVNPNVNSNASVIILKNSGLTNSGLLRIAIPAGNGSYANNATLNDIVFRNETTGGSIIIGAKDDVKIGAGGGDYDTRMIVNSSGRVGIGTVSPASPLNVKSNSSSSSDSGITLTQNGGSNAIFKMGEKSTDGGRFHMYDSGVEKIAFYTDGTANHISAGNVGIGVASPAKLLDVDGVGKFRGGSSEGQVLELGQLSYNAAVGAISISYWDDTAGGTSSLTSGDHLEIYHGRWGATTTIARGGQGGAVPVASLYGAGSSAWLELYQPDSPTTNNNYTTKVRLRADGDSYFTNELGIGTTSPDTLLHIVNAGSGGTTTLKLEDNAREMFLGRDTIKVTTLDGSTAAQLYIGSNTTFSGTVTTGGNLAMGGAITGITGLYGASGTLIMYNNTYNFKNATSGQMMGLTSAGLMLKNNTFFMAEDADGDDINILGIHSNNNCYVGPSSNAWAGGAMLYGAASGTNAHVWYEGNAEIMRIADNGFLGIGTNSPASLLDVDGIMSMGVADATRPALTPTNWGYATTYRALMLGSSSTTYNTANTGSTTISMGYNPSGNSYNGFNGDGREILFRRGAQFVTPNAADNSMYLYNLVMLDGKIGIGTASPAAPLSVEIPNSGNTSGQELSRWTHSGQNTLSLYAYGGATDLMQFGAWNSEQNISIVTDSSGSISATNTKGIFIKSGGNVGIGNVSPGAKLHIGSRGTASDPSISSLDGIMFDFYNAGNPYQRKASIISNSADTSEAIMAFWTTAASGSASQKMTINGAGNVGIGVASPSRPLVVNGSSATFLSIVSGASDDGGILFGDSGADYDGQIRYNNSTHHMFFKTNNIEQMRISATGKFSIGNTNDSYKLDVTGNVRFTSDLRNEGRLLNSVGSASSPSYSFYSQGTAGMYRRGDGVGFSAGSTERVYIDASKMMITGAGVNTFRIQFPNDQRIFDNGSGGLKMGSASHELDLYSGSDPIRMYTGGIAGTERMRVHTDGKIGIGTTAPSFVLKVNVDNATYTDWETIAGFQSKRGADSETEAGLMINAIGDAMGGQISSNWYWTDNTGAKGNTGRSAGIFGISNSASSNSEFYWQNTAHNNTTLTTRMKIDNAHSLHVDADVVAYSSSV